MERNQDHESDWPATVAASSARLRQLCEKESEQEMAESLKDGEERLRLGLFRLVVMGEIKKGKSSFINALLGVEEAVPTGSDIATSTVFKILYGPERRYKVFFKSDIDSGHRPEPRTISEAEIADYGTEAGNSDNQKNVDFIGVEMPSPLLKSGLVIVDTPGVGGLFRKHRDITWQYAPRADAVCFVLDSVATVISKQEIDFLSDLTSKITKRVFFVQTKTDTVDEEQWKSWEIRNREVLIEKLGIPKAKLKYFPVSSQLKHEADESKDGFDLNESGFLPVLDFLNRGLIEVKERELAKDVARVAATVAGQLAASISERRRIFASESQEQLEEIREEITNTKERFASWRNTILQEQLRTFGEGMTDLRRNTENRLQDDLDPNGPYVDEVIERLRAADEASAKDFNEGAGVILQECVSDLSKIVMDAQGDYNYRFEKLLADTLQSLAKGLDEHVVAEGTEVTSEPVRELEMHVDPAKGLNVELSGSFSQMQRGLMGGAAGAMVANIGVVLVGAVFPPALAVAPIAPWIGGAIGGWALGTEQEKRERAQVLDRLRGELSKVVFQLQKKALTQFRTNADDVERRSRQEVDKLVGRIQENLETKMKELSEAQKMSSEEASKRVKEADATLKQIEIENKRVQSILTS